MQSTTKAREELEGTVWAWVDKIQDPDRDPISKEDLFHAYKLFFPTHQSPKWKCKKNCRQNPNCFCGLGEAQWLDTNIVEVVEDDEDDMSLEERYTDMPVGLKNLGNTCYVNSFLQIWFHNVPFRTALYKWDPSQDALEADNESQLEAENYRPRGKVASLQALFSMMEFSNRRAVDPNDFIAKLGLDPQVQQDAAEFSKLFISLLESSLSCQVEEEVRQIVQNQFRGEYAYVTKCCHCQRESKTPSYFYELDLPLQGQKTLLSCLQDFLKDEKLEGDNQYFCQGCECKRDAKRCVRLCKLPPVLNLQLNRFIFDMQTGRKKKLNSLVHFPEVLEMASYLREEPSDENTFHLTGVLMHVGAEASHGHYIAHIQEATTAQWFKFSDAQVERLQQGRNRLGAENDPFTINGHSSPSSNGFVSARKLLNGSGTPNGKKINPSTKGMQGSNNAYMLVYTSAKALAEIRSSNNSKSMETPPSKKLKKSSNVKSEMKKLEDGPLPMYLKAFIEQDRRLLENELQERILLKQTKHKEQASLKSKMKGIYEKLPFQLEQIENGDPDESQKSFEFIPMEWLIQYFSNPSRVTPIDTTSSVCLHGHLDLQKVQAVKAVNKSIADQLYKEAFKGDLKIKRLNQDSLCEMCVRNRCRTMILARSFTNDNRLINDLLKQTPSPDGDQEAFWMGKITIKKWRQYARKNLDERLHREALEYAEEQPKLSLAEVQDKLSKVGTDVIVNANGHANHNNHETDHETFNSDMICQHGQLCLIEGRRRLVSKEIWTKMKAYFPDAQEFAKDAPLCTHCQVLTDKAKLALERRRETANKQKTALSDILNERNRPSWSRPSLEKVYLVPRTFINEWRLFVRSPHVREVVTLIPNQILLCQHGGLVYPLDLSIESDYDSVVYMVTEEEWSILKENFSVDQEIFVTKSREDSDFILETEPPVCDECVLQREKQEEDKQLVYRNVTVYVRRLTGSEKFPEKDNSDPDYDMFGKMNGNSKRMKMSNGHCVTNGSCSADFVRRSNRRQKVRGEREFTVSSTTLLRDLKVKIMEAFKVAPFDQNLCLNGQYLTDSSKTLGELRVLPKSLIYLRADEPNPVQVEPDDGWAMQHPEEGFKGTGLLEGI